MVSILVYDQYREQLIMFILCIHLCSLQVSFTVLHGPILDEVHQQLNPWVSQVNYGWNYHGIFFLKVSTSLPPCSSIPGPSNFSKIRYCVCVNLFLWNSSMEILFCLLLLQITRIYKAKEHAEVEFTVGYLVIWSQRNYLFHF